MRDLNFVSDKLDEFTRDLGASSFSGFLEDTKLKVKKMAADDTFHIDLLYHSGAAGETETLLKQLNGLTANTNYQLQPVNENTSSIRIFQQMFPALAIVLFDDYFRITASFAQKLKQMTEPYKVIIFINLCSNDEEIEKYKRNLNYNTKSYVINAADAAGKSIDDLLLSVLEKKKLEKLNALGYFNSVKPIFYFLNDILISENKTIQTRKQLNTQSVQITKKEETGTNFTDVQNNIRALIQKSGQDLEKNYRIKYEDLNKPKIGRFSQIADEWTQSLKEFDREDLAEKTERIAVKIKEPYKKDFIANVSKSIQAELAKDEVFIRSSINDMLVRINTMLQSKNVPPVNVADIDIPFPSKEKITRSYCYIAKEYTGELIKPGVNEYFVALRDYIGVIMIATSLLMPLQIIAGVSDDHSFFAFMKPFAKGVRLGSALITVLLVLYGIYDLRKRIPRKRQEEFLRELGKGKESLFTEAKRMFNDSSRDWVTSISSWIKDVSQNISNQLEKKLKELNQSKVSQMNVEVQQQQRLQQSIESIQRSLQTAERNKDMLTQKFRDLVIETEKDLSL
jgi:gas vesicle protein